MSLLKTFFVEFIWITLPAPTPLPFVQHSIRSLERIFKWNNLYATFEFVPVHALRVRLPADLAREGQQARMQRRQSETEVLENTFNQVRVEVNGRES